MLELRGTWGWGFYLSTLVFSVCDVLHLFFVHRYLMLSLQNSPVSHLSVNKAQAVSYCNEILITLSPSSGSLKWLEKKSIYDRERDGGRETYLLWMLQCLLFQIISLIPTSWYKDGSVVTRPLQGLVRFLVHLAEQLHRASIGQPDVERKNSRLVGVHEIMQYRGPRKCM